MEKTFKQPSQQRSQKRMEQVLQSAKILLETLPIEQVSIPEIAKHSGVPRSSIYQFFPTITSLINEITRQYMHSLLSIWHEKASHYFKMSILEISTDLIHTTAIFYNQNHLASLLILNGSLSTELYQTQQSIIQLMAQNIIYVLQHLEPPINIHENDFTIEYALEFTFAMMKHSYFKNGQITPEAIQEIIELNSIYLQHKGLATPSMV